MHGSTDTAGARARSRFLSAYVLVAALLAALPISVIALGTPEAPPSYALVLALAAAVLFLPVGLTRPRRTPETISLILVALSAAVASFAALLTASSFVQ